MAESYEARRDDDLKKQQEHEANKKTAKVVAKGAGAYFGGAAGEKAVSQIADSKVGDKVLTTSGVYGTITEIKFDDTRKMVVLETGGKIKSYMSVDAYAIYTVFKSDAELAREAAKAEEAKKEEPKATTEEKPAEEAPATDAPAEA